ncbi:hypothetical protein KZ483_08885 [Paenibacillus sp. sptzw28]|uniref:hypothetical protein n=1 Tax=Paenibacillus sp. sptzw28 TaxID=715179 RepID=UPI001C6DFE9C|nr:hypothetical protein [Paenibacillus sp. sptzw28]QYR23021.1 hypothetical protein KZ483_08885 [Paenibacillus sp. sptzw28]
MRKSKPARSSKRHNQAFRISRSKPNGQSKHKRRRIRTAPRLSSGSLRPAYEAGSQDAASLQGGSSAIQDPDWLKRRINDSWTGRCGSRDGGQITDLLLRQGKAYADGFTDALRWPRQSWLPVPLDRTAAAVVLTGGKAIDRGSLEELLRLPLQEIIVILRDAEGREFSQIRNVPGITIVYPGEPFGGIRSVGAKISNVDTVLFADGSKRIPAERLAILLKTVDSGADVAISDTTASLGVFRNWDDLSRVRAFINWSLRRPELGANSAETLPNAWSRRAIETIGITALAIPPIAHQAAIGHDLNIAVCPNIREPKEKDGSTKLSLDEHIEALKAAMELKGSRLTLYDRVRRRSHAGGGRQ